MTEQNRLETIREISLRTGKPFKDVMEVYTKFNQETYFSSYQSGTMHLIYTPTLEEEVARKTEEFCRK
jgi:hypothetical protein